MEIKETKATVTVGQKVLLLLASTGISLALILLLGQFVPYGQSNLTQAIILKSWELKKEVFGTPEIGIFEADPELGWKLKPGSKGKHFQPYGFNAKYTIDEEGHRITPGSYNLPKVLFLGGSFSFGHGVQDDENYIYLLGEQYPDYKMLNGAVMAWGTAQAWQKLQRAFEKYDDIEVVVYGFITYHMNRNYTRKTWLELVESWDRKNPHFEIQDGEPIFQGLADAEKDGIPGDEYCDAREREITLLFLQKMKTYCDDRNVPFSVVHIPSGEDASFDIDIVSVLGDSNVLDLRNRIDYKQMKLKGDAHPSPEGHRQIADSLLPFLQEKIARNQYFSGDNINAVPIN